jgi:septum formation protein
MTVAATPPDPLLVLASRSPQRRAILSQLGVPFRVVPSRYDEAVVPGDPVTTVVENARGKAAEVAGREARGRTPGHLVLGVDTVVVLGERVLGKASSTAEAATCLAALSGRTHEVYSGLCLIGPHDRAVVAHAVTAVTFRTLPATTVAAYVASGEWRERAGAYAIQGLGSALVTAIAGDYWNVVGLPVPQLLDGLQAFGLAPFAWL